MDKNGTFRKLAYDSSQYRYENDFLMVGGGIEPTKYASSSRVSTENTVKPPESSTLLKEKEINEESSHPSLFDCDTYSEICKIERLEDLDLQDFEPIGAMKSRGCNTRIVIEGKVDRVEKLRILNIGLKTTCCGRLIVLNRNRETNIFQLGLPKLVNRTVGECLECADFEFTTGKFELRGGKPRVEVGRCNLSPKGFIVTTVGMLGFCMNEWSKKSEIIKWKE